MFDGLDMGYAVAFVNGIKKGLCCLILDEQDKDGDIYRYIRSCLNDDGAVLCFNPVTIGSGMPDFVDTSRIHELDYDEMRELLVRILNHIPPGGVDTIELKNNIVSFVTIYYKGELVSNRDVVSEIYALLPDVNFNGPFNYVCSDQKYKHWALVYAELVLMLSSGASNVRGANSHNFGLFDLESWLVLFKDGEWESEPLKKRVGVFLESLGIDDPETASFTDVSSEVKERFNLIIMYSRYNLNKNPSYRAWESDFKS